MHAEAVLLVDDRQRKVVEGDALLHQRMGADHHLRAAAGHVVQRADAGAAGDLAREPCDLDAERGQPAAQVRQVLFGEQFGGRHQRGLAAVGDRHQRGHRRDHGLAGADVALHQAQHRHRPREVGADFAEDPLLRRGQGEGQLRAQLQGQHVAHQRRGRMRLPRDPLPAHAEVVRQQFLHREPALRGMGAGQQRLDIGIARRPVHGEQGFAQPRQPLAVQPPARQQLQHLVAGKAIERVRDQPLQRRGTDAFHRRIHGIEAVAERVASVVAEHRVAGMHDLQPTLARTRGAIGADAHAGLELRRLRAAEMEEAQHQGRARVVAQRDAQHRPVAEAALHRFHPALDLGGHARLQQPDRRQRGAVLVAAGQLQPEVLQRAQAARGQLLRDPRPHPGQRGDRGGAARSESGRGRGRTAPRRRHRVSRGPSPRRPRTARPWAAPTPRWSNARDTVR